MEPEESLLCSQEEALSWTALTETLLVSRIVLTAITSLLSREWRTKRRVRIVAAVLYSDELGFLYAGPIVSKHHNRRHISRRLLQVTSTRKCQNHDHLAHRTMSKWMYLCFTLMTSALLHKPAWAGVLYNSVGYVYTHFDNDFLSGNTEL
jgi:hypothetical protein